MLGSEVTADLGETYFDQKSNHRASGLSTKNLSLSQFVTANCQDAVPEPVQLAAQEKFGRPLAKGE